MRGLVIKTTGNSYTVQPMDSEAPVTAYVKGNFRIRGIRSTNPVAVGDYVQVEQQSDGTNWITDIEDRRNYIVRRSTNLSKQTHILAANIDQAVLLVTVAHPVTSTTFIDRFLATAEAYRVPAVLVFNKLDILTDSEKQTLASWQELYGSLGYPCYAIAATTMDAAELLPLFAGKVSLLSGNSGVGKSTLLNTIAGRQIAVARGAITDGANRLARLFPLDSPRGIVIEHCADNLQALIHAFVRWPASTRPHIRV